MRALKYKLADGTIVNDYPTAVNSGQKFTDYMENVSEANPNNKTGLIRHFALQKFGIVNTNTIKAVEYDAINQGAEVIF